jgi:hypothetical protein
VILVDVDGLLSLSYGLLDPLYLGQIRQLCPILPKLFLAHWIQRVRYREISENLGYLLVGTVKSLNFSRQLLILSDVKD